ncbi:uncharacterized protein LOC126594746 [Malus sylvestris]|uniref:uncharacterized protein LOC126594746 n=1 Tax=Malus sylvestris TaxID=3752 RepID=UPI0021AD495A|nr:uncharacterized protein LOC126594746 [Malus sylvestris]
MAVRIFKDHPNLGSGGEDQQAWMLHPVQNRRRKKKGGGILTPLQIVALRMILFRCKPFHRMNIHALNSNFYVATIRRNLEVTSRLGNEASILWTLGDDSFTAAYASL